MVGYMKDVVQHYDLPMIAAYFLNDKAVQNRLSKTEVFHVHQLAKRGVKLKNKFFVSLPNIFSNFLVWYCLSKHYS
jgi:hypothetical protein